MPNNNETPLIIKNTYKSGIVLLIIVNILWVVSAEITRYIFVDLNLRRPLLITYVKSCMFSMYLLKFIIGGNNKKDPPYGNLEDIEEESSEFEVEGLSGPEYEPVTDVIESGNDSDTVNGNNNTNGHRRRSVRFADVREIRRMPDSSAEHAREARRSYHPPSFDCTISPMLKYSFYFCPLWFFSSTTYQASLMFSSVASVNLISASSSLFVLVFTAICPKRLHDKFTLTKLCLVLLNMFGVALVSQFSESLFGSVLALTSAISYAIYLTGFSMFTNKYGNIDINILFGFIGFFSLFFCTPLIILVHFYGIESQLPLPTLYEFGIVLLNGFVGSVLADWLWLYATMLTTSLISSIAMSLSIPMAMLADVICRGKVPSFIELIASIPILISFIGSALINQDNNNGNNNHNNRSSIIGSGRLNRHRRGRRAQNSENEALLDENNDQEY
uniref:EamA domain-containing protein n=1 Tax=Strongyloides stercoralis TaxID=6248 RepID=A0A0K0EHM1_STRER